MPRHFAYLGSYNAPKNTLHNAALAVLRNHSGRIVDSVSRFVKELGSEIDDLNKKHPRCAPLRVSDWLIGSGWGISLGSHFTISFYLYEIKEDS